MAIQGPMTGIRVIELGNMVAPDTCTRMMADLGAEVIKVENTALGDNFRVWPRTIGAPTREDFNPIFDNLNANKKSISVNLRTKEGLDIMYQLLGTAEIFITNVRTKGLEHMGLGYDVLKEKFPSSASWRPTVPSAPTRTSPATTAPHSGRAAASCTARRLNVKASSRPFPSTFPWAWATPPVPAC